MKARRLAGVIVKDLWRYERALRSRGAAYLAICNRDERLEPAPAGLGYECKWKWTSDLHAPKLMPSLGRRLMQRVLSDHPIVRAGAPLVTDGEPEITFLIGHRGLDRLPHLLATLQSIAGQAGARVECLVVEQDTQSRIAQKLPAWVRHVLTPPPVEGMAYCRSWTFNIGARLAASPVLVLHDNDMLVPRDYSESILGLVRAGREVINLKRFIFYLTREHSEAVFSGNAALTDASPEAIVQNLEGGGSVAITRKAYEEIGGLDETFIGWGGEDNEFWERAQTRAVWPFASLPLVHLWHAAQPGKQDVENVTLSRYEQLSRVSPKDRIARLRGVESGNLSGPVSFRSATK